jgi:hypothetical protein
LCRLWWISPFASPQPAKEEATVLEYQARILARELESVRDRIGDLKKQEIKMANALGRGRGFGRNFSGGMGFGFRGSSPPWPYVGIGRGGLPRCRYFFGAAPASWPYLPAFYGQPAAHGYGSPEMAKKQELDYLKNQADAIKRQLDQIESRMRDLESVGESKS